MHNPPFICAMCRKRTPDAVACAENCRYAEALRLQILNGLQLHQLTEVFQVDPIDRAIGPLSPDQLRQFINYLRDIVTARSNDPVLGAIGPPRALRQTLLTLRNHTAELDDQIAKLREESENLDRTLAELAREVDLRVEELKPAVDALARLIDPIRGIGGPSSSVSSSSVGKTASSSQKHQTVPPKPVVTTRRYGNFKKLDGLV
ncbi:putative transcription factor AS2-LOB family [Helianthus debilis subsp. tardiflorus]